MINIDQLNLILDRFEQSQHPIAQDSATFAKGLVSWLVESSLPSRPKIGILLKDQSLCVAVLLGAKKYLDFQGKVQEVGSFLSLRDFTALTVPDLLDTKKLWAEHQLWCSKEPSEALCRTLKSTGGLIQW